MEQKMQPFLIKAAKYRNMQGIAKAYSELYYIIGKYL